MKPKPSAPPPPHWPESIALFARTLRRLSILTHAGSELPVDAGFQRWRTLTRSVRRRRRTIYLVGNGASASMASHFAADLAKNGHLHTEVFSDLSLLTAVANDVSYEQVFALPLQRRGRSGDLLVAISSSGRSPNILAAARMARQLQMKIVTLTGMTPDNPLRTMGDLNLYVPGRRYGTVETCHAALLHHWMDLVEVHTGA